jgi:hypothetical protein
MVQANDIDGALDLFARAEAAEPDNPQVRTDHLRALEYACAWAAAARRRCGVIEATRKALADRSRPAENPFDAVARNMDPAYGRAVAEAWSRWPGRSGRPVPGPTTAA